MSDHLPECGYKPCNCGYEDDPRGNWAGHLRCSHVPCICDRLRACEQRMYEWSRSFGVGKTFYNAGRLDALDAAWEAVERVSTLFEPLGPALDAIDALREEQK